MTKCKEKIFKGSSYRDLLHFVASDDYKPSQVCRTGNKRFYVKNNKVYCDSVLVAIIDRQKEVVLELDWGCFRSNIYGNILWSMSHAFDHYNILKLPALNKKDIQSWLNQTLVSSRASYKRIKDLSWEHQMNTVKDSKKYGDIYGVQFKSIDELESLDKTREDYWQKKYKKESELERERREHAEEDEKEDWLKYTKLCQDVLKEYPEATSIFDQALVLIQHRWNRDEKDKLEKEFKCMCIFRYAYNDGFGLWSNHVFKVLNLPVLPNGRTPDLIWYDVKKDSFVTSQNVEVEVKGLVNKLLDTVIAAGSSDDHELMETVLKKSAGAYEIREFDWDSKSLRVGCHVFAWDNLVYLQKKYYGLEVERHQSIEDNYNRLIQDCESTINKQMALISKYRAKLKLLKKNSTGTVQACKDCEDCTTEE